MVVVLALWLGRMGGVIVAGDKRCGGVTNPSQKGMPLAAEYSHTLSTASTGLNLEPLDIPRSAALHSCKFGVR